MALGALTLILPLLPSAAQEAPLARITLPTRGQTVRGNVTVQGSATSPQIARYEVAYAAEPDVANWTVINGAVQPVANGGLAVWNTRPVPDGLYALRLQVFSVDGSVAETLVRNLTLANTATSPTGLEAGTVVTGTTTGDAENAVSTGSTAEGPSLELSDIPAAFVKGARYTLYAFLALAAYVLLKRLIGYGVRKLLKKPVNYGR